MQRALACIVGNCGLDAGAVADHVAPAGHGPDARSSRLVDMFGTGIIDPVKVGATALHNPASMAALN